MKHKDIKTLVEKVKTDCEHYLAAVEELGNECAFTDRMVETIISDAEKLKNDYESQFEEVSLS